MTNGNLSYCSLEKNKQRMYRRKKVPLNVFNMLQHRRSSIDVLLFPNFFCSVFTLTCCGFPFNFRSFIVDSSSSSRLCRRTQHFHTCFGLWVYEIKRSVYIKWNKSNKRSTLNTLGEWTRDSSDYKEKMYSKKWFRNMEFVIDFRHFRSLVVPTLRSLQPNEKKFGSKFFSSTHLHPKLSTANDRHTDSVN